MKIELNELRRKKERIQVRDEAFSMKMGINHGIISLSIVKKRTIVGRPTKGCVYEPLERTIGAHFLPHLLPLGMNTWSSGAGALVIMANY